MHRAGALGACTVKEARPPRVEHHVGGPHVGVLRLADEHHAGGRRRGHRAHGRVVGVQHGEALGGQRRDELGLRGGDRRARPELADVGGADVEHDADPWGRHPGEVGDVADAAGPHLDHEEAGVGGDPADRQRHADLGVVRPDRGHRGPGGGQHGAEEVLGARLARRAGDADHGQARHAPHDLAGQRGEGLLGVGDHDARHALDRARDQGRDSTPLDGAGHEVVPVGVLATAGDEQPARAGLARVGRRPGRRPRPRSGRRRPARRRSRR